MSVNQFFEVFQSDLYLLNGCCLLEKKKKRIIITRSSKISNQRPPLGVKVLIGIFEDDGLLAKDLHAVDS